jgi:hypothetical protein
MEGDEHTSQNQHKIIKKPFFSWGDIIGDTLAL